MGLKRLTGGAETRHGASADRLREARRADSASTAHGGEAAALGNTSITFPVSNRRAERYAFRDQLREITAYEGLQKCGKVPIAPLVSLRGEQGGRAGYGGLATCGSAWLCPVCGAKIAAHRRDEVAAIIARAAAEGLEVSLLTLTMRHHAGQRLADLWPALTTAWNRVTSGRRWTEFGEQLGLVGWVKSVEVTHGVAGWHVHQHVLIISEKSPETTPIFWQRRQGRRRTPYPVEVQTARDFVAKRWAAGLAKHDLDFVADSGGLDWRTASNPGDLAGYLTKVGGKIDALAGDSLANEVTLGAMKSGRRENRAPFQIARDFLATGDPGDLAIWSEWAETAPGHRGISYSKGLREWAGLGLEMTDEEVAEAEHGDEAVALFDHDAWRQIRAAGAAELLSTLELGGEAAAYLWLEERHIGYRVERGSPPS